MNAELTVKKIDILLGSQCRPIDTTELTGMDGQINIINTTGVDVGQERGGDSGARIVGAPVGSPEYAAKFVADIVDKHRARLDHIAKFGEDGHAQEALLLLRLCACPRITFLLQCVRYNIAPQAFNDSYRDILSAFGRIAGITEELDTADEVTRGRIALPLRHGGQGLIDPSHIADQALVANWAACAPFLANTAPALSNIANEKFRSTPQRTQRRRPSSTGTRPERPLPRTHAARVGQDPQPRRRRAENPGSGFPRVHR